MTDLTTAIMEIAEKQTAEFGGLARFVSQDEQEIVAVCFKGWQCTVCAINSTTIHHYNDKKWVSVDIADPTTDIEQIMRDAITHAHMAIIIAIDARG
jgi:hypothetical protein